VRLRTAIGCSVAVILAASSVATQEAPKPDTLPFHKGQWAAQFVVGTDFVSAGVLHFRSPKSAWLLDGRFGYGYSESHFDGDTLYPSTSDTQNAGSVSLRFGLRNYKPLGNSTQFFTTFGALVGGGGGKVRGTFSGNDWFWAVGAFGELGANYMITPHIGFGAAAGLQVTYRQSGTERATNGSKDEAIAISGALLSLQLGIYF
jgi:hypothetical protein